MSATEKDPGEGAPQSVQPAPAGSLDRASVLVLAGGVALAVSPFLTWVKVFLLGDLSLFQLFDAAGRSSSLAWGAVVAGGVAAVVAFRVPPRAGASAWLLPVESRRRSSR